jgi:hypothetical protein
MPRRRPGALRAEGPGSRAWVEPPPDWNHGLFARTSFLIHRVERLPGDCDIFSGVTDRALRAGSATELHDGVVEVGELACGLLDHSSG